MLRHIYAIAFAAFAMTACSSTVIVPDAASDPGAEAPAAVSTPSAPAAEAPAAVSTPSAPAARCLEDVTYRAQFTEFDAETGEQFVQYLHEIAEDYARVEPAVSADGLIVFAEGDAWIYEGDVWQELPTQPVRLLRLPWVNNFVTGAQLADSLTAVGSETIDGLATNRYEPTLEEMLAVFPAKFREIEYEADTTAFTYWLDQCDQVIRAVVRVTIADADGSLAAAGFPLQLRYTYDLYDIGEVNSTIVRNQVAAPIPTPG